MSGRKDRDSKETKEMTLRTISSLLALAAIALCGALGTTVASAAPVLESGASHLPNEFSTGGRFDSGVPLGSRASFLISVANVGDVSTSEPVTVNFSAPPGLEIFGAAGQNVRLFFGTPVFDFWHCSVAPNGQTASCTTGQAQTPFGPFPFPFPAIGPGEESCVGLGEVFGHIDEHCRVRFAVTTSPGTEPGDEFTVTSETCGGGAAGCDVVQDSIQAVPSFEATGLDMGALSGTRVNLRSGENRDPILEQSGPADTRAGAHPQTFTTRFMMTQASGLDGRVYSSQDQKDVIADLPPGALANAEAIPTCTDVQLGSSNSAVCPDESQVGFIGVYQGGATLPRPGAFLRQYYPIYNMEAPEGKYALMGFNYLGAVFHLTGRLARDPSVPGGYRARVGILNSPQTLAVLGAAVTVWGVPAAENHDFERGYPEPGEGRAELWGKFCLIDAACANPTKSEAPEVPYYTSPTSCEGPTQTDLKITSWQGAEAHSSVLSHAVGEPDNLIGTSACNTLDFSPTVKARPTTSVADAASGLDVNIHIPQNEDPLGQATAHLKDTVVSLPEGLVINPSSANGLGACSEAQYAQESEEPSTCPEASKVGTVTVETPLIDHPVLGSVYLATPFDNPFDNLITLYISVSDPETGTVVKLPVKVEADPNTGQITATSPEAPQTPFEDFKFHFFGGANGALRTPATCGTYTTETTLTPWSYPETGPPDTPSDSWSINQAPNGGTCPTSQSQRPNSPDLDAGAVSPIAATATPTVVNLRRDDGSQEFSSVSLTLPPGLTGKLSGISQCSDAALAAAASKSGNEEKSSPSCPANSRIGVVDVAAGAGPAPYNTQGIAYLTGPYKGAPLGMAIITPATAGPFDLGTVVTRAALNLDRNSARVTATTDQIPSILQGIPLDVRSARVLLDRPDFTRTGTSCDPYSFEGSLTTTLGQVAPLSERFQLAECTGLSFKPKLAIRLFGGTKRGAHPALKATLQMPAGGANIAKASVALPHSEFLDQAHIGTVCTRVQFAAKECPAASVYGQATATSPLVDYPLEGNAYLRSSDNELPDLVIALHGPASQPIEVDVVGRIDSVKGGIRTTFEGVPDLPVSGFTLNMAGGKKGLLQNSTNICKGKHRATAEFDGQNGKAADLKPMLKNGKCGKSGKAKKRKAARQSAR